ncbi:MAG: DUF6502 family protein [Candidatus Binatia bacterium]
MLPRALKQQFVVAIERMMRPVVRQLIAYGVSYPAFSRIVKQVYFDVAQQEFALSFKQQTDSRLSLVTGIHRKEIAELRRRGQAPRTPEVEDTLVTHVIGRWMAGPPYADTDGTPRRLAYEAGAPRGPSFARLVRELGTDIPVRSVLDELLRVGAVNFSGDGDVVLLQEAHIPAGDAAGKLTLLGSDPAELFSTIVHNLEHPDAPRPQRKVVYDNIGAEALPEVRAAARRLAEDFIRRANSLLAAHDRDRNPRAAGGPRTRVVLAAHYFEEGVASPEPPPSKQDARPTPGRIRRSQ